MPSCPTIIILTWDPLQGHAVPDALAMGCVESKIKELTESNSDFDHIIGTDCLLNSYRLAIVEKKIAPHRIILKHKGEVHEFNEFGNFVGGWPVGLASDNDDTVRDIIMTQIKIRKERRK